jgi:hypothetical protein
MLPQRLKSHRSFCNGTAEAVPSHLSIANSPEMSVTNEHAVANHNGRNYFCHSHEPQTGGHDFNRAVKLPLVVRGFSPADKHHLELIMFATLATVSGKLKNA